MTPLFIYTDIEYKNQERNNEAVCIYTFPDIELVTADLDNTDLEDGLSLQVHREITNLERFNYGVSNTNNFYLTVQMCLNYRKIYHRKP